MRRISMITTVTGGLAVLLVAGCVTPARQLSLPGARLLGGQNASAGAATSPGDRPSPPAATPTGKLTLEAAIAAALVRSPELAAYSYDVRAAEARILQAGVPPNPELEFEVEEYDRGGEGFGSAETAVVLAQAFELGGKRRWRKRIAEAEGELTGWDFEAKRLDVIAETAKRFTAVLAAQERLALAQSAVGQ